MPRPEKARTRGNTTADNMKQAITRIQLGESLRLVSKTTGIPFTTLRRYYLKSKEKGTLDIRLVPNYEVNKVFSREQEEIISEYFRYCALLFYGLNTKECRKIAYQMAKINNLKMPQSWTTKQMAGKDWLKAFRKRHPELSLRRPEPCSLARATAFNRVNVNKFYDNLENLIKRNPAFSDGTRIFNLDETSTTTVQKPQRVIAPKGRKSLGKVTSGEKGTLVTTCCIISASGSALPPIMVFPRKNFKDFMCKNTPTGTLGLASPTGWMNSDLFPEVIKHFIKHTNSSPENQSILILDNHESHLSIAALDLAKASGVHVLTLHPHTSGKLQPLDVGIFGPFKIFYNAAIESWMLRNPGKPVTIYDIGELVGVAFLKVMTPSNITSAFKKCGIFPFDRFIFNDDDFLPSSVTDRPCPDCSPREENEPQLSRVSLPVNVISPTLNSASTSQIVASTSNIVSTVDTTPVSTLHCAPAKPTTLLSAMDDLLSDLNANADNTPGFVEEDNSKDSNVTYCEDVENNENGHDLLEAQPYKIINSRTPLKHVPTPSNSPTPSASKENNAQLIISPFDFREPIKAGPRKSNRKRRKLGRSMIATDTPEKTEIEMEKTATQRRKESKTKKVSKKVMQSDSEDEDVEIHLQDSDDDQDCDWTGEKENEVSILTEKDLQLPLPHLAQEGEYVLVEFATKKKILYYVGKILQTRNKDLEYQISFLRKYRHNKFRVPNVPDISFVKDYEVKFILPKPICSGSTSRQQSFYSFPLDLSLLHIN